MDEQKLYDILGQNLEVPPMIDEKLKQTYAQLEGRRAAPKQKRRRLHPLRTVLIAAAVIAALCGTATAAYNFFRKDVPVNPEKTIQGIWSSGQHNWQKTEVYNDYGKLMYYWPNRETAPMDEAQAQALLGDYLPECGYQWQVEDYTFTVEGYVLDEHTGTARFYYSVEHPGGFPEDAVDRNTGTLSYKSGISVAFTTKSDVDWPWLSGNLTFVDMERSTPEKLYLMEGGASGELGWKAEDGLSITFKIIGEIDRGDDVLRAQLEVPGVKSLPVVESIHPDTGELAVTLSPIAVRVDMRYLRQEAPDGTVIWDDIRYLALEYTDGSAYVVFGDNVYNADYGVRDEEGWSTSVFNRLVDPSQVAAVIVDDYRYEIG